MTHSIHLMPHFIREYAKQAVSWYVPGGDVLSLPFVTGIGIGDGHVKVTIARKHPAHDLIPTELPGSLPVLLEEQPPHSHHARAKTKGGGGGGRGGGGQCDASSALAASKVAGPLQGGMPLVCGDTAFGFLVDTAGAKYVVGAAHSFAYLTGGVVSYNNQTIGTFTKSGLACGQTANHLDASIAKVGPTVSTSFSILGLGAPKGLSAPTINSKAHMQGAYGGARVGTVTTINYGYKDDYGGEGNLGKSCPVTHADCFQVANKSGIDGDSGAAVWNDAGQLTGLHFDGDSAGALGTNSKVTYMPTELGVNTSPLAAVVPALATPAPAVALHSGSDVSLLPPAILIAAGALVAALLLKKP